MGLLVALLLHFAASPCPADRIILRNLQILDNKTVKSFDEDGVILDGFRLITWDEIERGQVDPDRQEAFDRMLAELGDPLYRIRRRLEDGDYKSIPPATDDAGAPERATEYKSLLTESEAVYPRYQGRTSKTAYMVFQGLMWARLEAGRRAEALQPYFDSYAYLRKVGEAGATLPGDRRLQVDMETGLTQEIAPVWFDDGAARKAMPKVLAAVGRIGKPLPDGARIYYATLALAAGDEKAADQALEGLKPDRPAIAQLLDVVEAQREVERGQPGPAVERLQRNLHDLAPEVRPLAFYWTGMAGIASDDLRKRREGALNLLHLPALFGKGHPELAAAGLYHAMKTLSDANDPIGAAGVRRELLGRYSQTYFAAELRSRLRSPKDRHEVKP